eukprot:scaffold6011_cov137-Isochrysis_galbana.AAC.3
MSSSFCASVIMLARRSVYSRLSVAMHAHQIASAVERGLPSTMKAGARARAMLLAPRGLGSTLLRNPLSRAGVEAMRMPAFFDLLDPAVQKSIERPLEELVDRYIHDIASKQLVIDEKERAMQRVIDEKERAMQRVIDEKERVIDEKERVIDEKERVIDEKERAMQCVIDEKGRHPARLLWASGGHPRGQSRLIWVRQGPCGSLMSSRPVARRRNRYSGSSSGAGDGEGHG